MRLNSARSVIGFARKRSSIERRGLHLQTTMSKEPSKGEIRVDDRPALPMVRAEDVIDRLGNTCSSFVVSSVLYEPDSSLRLRRPPR